MIFYYYLNSPAAFPRPVELSETLKENTSINKKTVDGEKDKMREEREDIDAVGGRQSQHEI